MWKLKFGLFWGTANDLQAIQVQVKLEIYVNFLILKHCKNHTLIRLTDWQNLSMWLCREYGWTRCPLYKPLSNSVPLSNSMLDHIFCAWLGLGMVSKASNAIISLFAGFGDLGKVRASTFKVYNKLYDTPASYPGLTCGWKMDPAADGLSNLIWCNQIFLKVRNVNSFNHSVRPWHKTLKHL